MDGSAEDTPSRKGAGPLRHRRFRGDSGQSAQSGVGGTRPVQTACSPLQGWLPESKTYGSKLNDSVKKLGISNKGLPKNGSTNPFTSETCAPPEARYPAI
jgi:hypothetical protein